MNVTRFLLRSLLALVALSAHFTNAQPRLLPESLEGPLARELLTLEPRVWREARQARASLAQIQSRLESAGDNERVAFYLLLAQSLQYLHIDEVYADTVQRGVNALVSDTPQRVRLMLQLHDGVRMVRSGAYAEAIAHLGATFAASQSAGLTGIATLVRAELAYAQTVAGRHEVAVEELQGAHADAVASGDTFLVAVVNEVFGVLYTYIDEYERAVSHYRLALEDYDQLGYAVYIGEAVYGLATAHRYAGDYDAALSAFERYRDMTASLGDGQGRFMALYGLGSTHGDRGDCAQALVVIAEALSAIGPEDYKAELLKRAAVCHAQSGNALDARAALARAKATITGIAELRGTRWEIDLHRIEADMEAALGNFEAAYEAMVIFHGKKIALQEENASERRQSRREALENERQALRIELLQEQARVRSLELETQRRGLRQQRLWTAFLVFAGLVLGAVVLWRLRDMRRWRELSIRDPLTGVGNRRHAFARLEARLQELDPARGELSLVLLDIDDFKAVNDRYGHPEGDSVLQAIATALSALLRPGDELSRVGGEEFLLLLPRTGLDGATMVAERVREVIRELQVVSSGGDTLCVTASIGVAAVSRSRTTADAMYAAVDEALYRAKADGKDRVEVMPED
ncbi:MAG: diguanylate cyclase [Chromatocurvus sp.]